MFGHQPNFSLGRNKYAGRVILYVTNTNSKKNGGEKEMGKKIVWFAVSCLMALSLVMASCGPAAEEEEEEEEEVREEEVVEEEEEEEEEVVVITEVPEYGGTLTLAMINEYWDLLALGKGWPHQLAFNRLWDGDWAKGPAGGYGTNEVKWEEMTNIFNLKIDHLAESWEFVVDSAAGTVTTVFQIKQGIRYAQINTEAGRLVNGRELTADDVAWNITQLNNNPDAMNYRFFPQIHGIEAEKTGPWEVSITHSFEEHLGNIMRNVDNHLIFAPELYETYGTDVSNWDNAVGTGPYIIVDRVVDNMVTLVRNPNYWETNPVGPGKGDQLPYVEKVKFIVMPDLSTQQAALRSGNVEQMAAFNLEDKNDMTRRIPELVVAEVGSGYILPAYMRVDQPPFDDIRVRRAVMMAIDMESINDSLYAGLGTYPSWPYYYHEAYADLYMGLDDPTCPDSVRELFSYDPDKAKALLTEAGYPNGFKTSVTLTSVSADYYAIIKDMLAKVNIDMSLNILADWGQIMSVANAFDYEMMVPGVSPCATYPEQYQYTGGSYINGARLFDPYVDDMAEQARLAALTDISEAMAITKDLMPYLQDLALCIQTPRYPTYNLWWPWVKNYSGELSVGYFTGPSWIKYVWIDQDLKKSMGY